MKQREVTNEVISASTQREAVLGAIEDAFRTAYANASRRGLFGAPNAKKIEAKFKTEFEKSAAIALEQDIPEIKSVKWLDLGPTTNAAVVQQTQELEINTHFSEILADWVGYYVDRGVTGADSIIREQNVWKVIDYLAEILIHELVHLIQVQREPRQQKDYRSYLAKTGTQFADAMDNLGEPENFQMYLASPQEIPAHAHQMVYRLVSQALGGKPANQVPADEIPYVIQELKDTLKDVASGMSANDETLSDYLGFKGPDPRKTKVFQRFMKQVYQEVQAYIGKMQEQMSGQLNESSGQGTEESIDRGVRAYTAKGGPLASNPMNRASPEDRAVMEKWLSTGHTGNGIKLYQGTSFSEKDWDQIWEQQTTPGSIITLNSPSFSEDPNRVMGYRGGQYPVKYQLHGGVTGRDIQQQSVYPEEKEHLAAPGVKFRVIDANIKNGIWYVDIEEVDSGQLTESFDKPYEFKKASQYDRVNYGWVTDDGRQCGCQIRLEDSDANTWGLAFAVGKEIKQTGGGDAMRIFATVVACFKDWLANEGQDANGISFAGDLTEPSRIKLYDRFAKMMPRFGFRDIKSNFQLGDSKFYEFERVNPLNEKNYPGQETPGMRSKAHRKMNRTSAYARTMLKPGRRSDVFRPTMIAPSQPGQQLKRDIQIDRKRRKEMPDTKMSSGGATPFTLDAAIQGSANALKTMKKINKKAYGDNRKKVQMKTLDETFDKPLAWNKRMASWGLEYLFTTPEGKRVDMSVAINGAGVADIVFEVDGSIEVTGGGEAVAIFATVIDCMKNALGDPAMDRAWKIHFGASKDDPSRQKLYSRFAKILPQAGYEFVGTRDTNLYKEFEFVNPEKEKQFGPKKPELIPPEEQIEESASAGATCSGAIAPVARPLGGVIRRSGSSILSGISTAEPFPNTPDWMKVNQKQSKNKKRSK